MPPATAIARVVGAALLLLPATFVGVPEQAPSQPSAAPALTGARMERVGGSPQPVHAGEAGEPARRAGRDPAVKGHDATEQARATRQAGATERAGPSLHGAVTPPYEAHRDGATPHGGEGRRRRLAAGGIAALPLPYWATAATPRGPWTWPLNPPPQVVRRFAVGPHPWSPGHRGVDLGAGPGAVVLAPAPGVVTFAGPVAGRPVLVIAHDDGIRTSYEPVVATVRPGEAVARGQPVGEMFTSGGHCPGPVCLHWGARRGEVYIDPLTLVQRPPIVLLPLRGSG